MNIIGAIRQRVPDEFLYAHFDQPERASTFILNTDQNSTVSRDRPWSDWIIDNLVAGYLSVLNEFQLHNKWHRSFNGCQYFTLSLSCLGSLQRSRDSAPQIVSLENAYYHQTSSEKRQKLISGFDGILIALGLCTAGTFCQLFGLKRSTSNRAQGTIV